MRDIDKLNLWVIQNKKVREEIEQCVYDKLNCKEIKQSIFEQLIDEINLHQSEKISSIYVEILENDELSLEIYDDLKTLTQYIKYLYEIVEFLVENKKFNIDIKLFKNNIPPKILNILIQKLKLNFNEEELNSYDKFFILGNNHHYLISLLKNKIQLDKDEIKNYLSQFINNSEYFSEKSIFYKIYFLKKQKITFIKNLIKNAIDFDLEFEFFISEEVFKYLLIEDEEYIKHSIQKFLRGNRRKSLNSLLVPLNPNIKINNKSLLMFCIENYKIELSKFLIQKGADVNIILENGKNLLEFAEILKDKELINLIKSSPTYQPLDHNPKRLIEILTNFRKDSPIKYTTHLWDFNFKEEYGNFESYINQVKNQWDKIEEELKKLSPNLHKKIKLFLFQKDNNPWSSVEGDKLSIGWSNLDGLKEWCDRGNNPFEFELNKIYKVEGKSVTKFEDVVNVFKREIQIRNENNHLESIISDFEEKIFEKDENFEIEYEKLRGKSFYTDVEVFKKVLNRIFSEMLKRKAYPEIVIEARNDNENYFDLAIIQIDSFSNQSPEDMLKKSNGGDFGDIKKNLKNLCDWSIENKTADNKSYRVNYLISRPVKRIEELDDDIKGFTHILRFYK